MKDVRPPRATFRDVFAVREFRALWFSQTLSVAGDRLALVALTLLVYDRTRSPLLAAVTYAAGYLPWVIGGLFMAGLADRRPRRPVMVTCDLTRAALVAIMALPGVPLGALVALLFASTMFTPVFDPARAALTPDVLPGEQYALGAAALNTTVYVAQVAGAAGGGWQWPSSAFGPRSSLTLSRSCSQPCSSAWVSAPDPRPPGPVPSGSRRWPGCGTGSAWCSVTRH